MQSLSDFLASAPKTHLAKLYRHEFPEAGLVSGARVVEAVQARALDPDRIASVLDGLEPEGRRLLLAVYASEDRGMLESELVRGCDGGASAAGYFLGTLEYEQLILCREGESRSYHGFREVGKQVLPRLLAEFAPVAETPADTPWISNASHVASHFCHFLARAARGELRLTQTTELHRKSLLDLARGFASGEVLSQGVAAEEAVFLFRFAVDSDLLLEEDGVLRPSPLATEWLESGGEDLGRRLREWWLRKRVHGLSRLLKVLSERADGAVPARGVAGLSPLFAVYESWDKSKARAQADLCTWENLPRLLRELWMLGGAEFAMTKGRIRWARVPGEGEERDRGAASSEAARGLPNFEALVPAGIPLDRLFQIELVAQRENDEQMTRYRFTKDSVVAGLRAGMSAESLEELATWLGFETAARRVLAEWAATYVSTVFRDLFLLRVRDAARFRELEDFPQFMELVTEVIPAYGFVMPRAARERARELLRAFDLLPGDESAPDAAPTARRLPPADGDTPWSLPLFPHGETVFRHAPPLARREPPAADRAPKDRAETPAQRLKSLENAIRAQRSVEFTYAPGTARVQVQPLHVLRNREPMKLIAVELSSGHRNEYALDQVLALRVLETA